MTAPNAPSDNTERNNDIETFLPSVLSFVDSHVRFAEAKNSALLAANAVAAAAVLAVLTGKDPHGLWVTIYLADLAAFSILSTISCLLSFLPRTEIPWLHRRGRCGANDDLMFFGDIQKYTPDGYLTELRSRTGQPYSSTYIDKCYARQIVVNARIASRKFTYFRYAIWLTVSAALSPIGAMLLRQWLTNAETF